MYDIKIKDANDEQLREYIERVANDIKMASRSNDTTERFTRYCLS